MGERSYGLVLLLLSVFGLLVIGRELPTCWRLPLQCPLSPRRRVRVVEKEAQHLSRRIGPARVRVGALETAAGPCVATPVHNPLFQHLRPEIVCM